MALSLADTQMQSDDNKDLSTKIIQIIQSIQAGKKFGIPQGSVIFDLIAEIILGYSDILLTNEIKKSGINCNYEILRYRDDYRIFCNDKDVINEISYLLQGVLRKLDFDMNNQKTYISDDLITDSIKSDKLSYIYNTPIFNKKGCDFDGFQKYLLYIFQFARKQPNSGQIKTLLSDLSARIDKRINPSNTKLLIHEYVPLDVTEKDDSENNNEEKQIGEKQSENYLIFDRLKKYPYSEHKTIYENIKAMSAIATQIAIENISCAHYALEVISKLISVAHDNEKKEIMQLVRDKLLLLPNSSYIELWLQTMTYQIDKDSRSCPYSLSICKIIMGEKATLWNTTWLKPKYTNSRMLKKIFNNKVLKDSKSIITFKERRTYL